MDNSNDPHGIAQSGGVYHIRALPAVKPPIPASGGRIFDSAGELARIIDGYPVHFAAYIEFLLGGRARGNHVHRCKTEWLYVISGTLEAIYVNTLTGDRSRALIQTGDLVTVYPDCAHVYWPVGERAQAIEFASHGYDSADIIPYPIRTDLDQS
jgi:hypothetical protein